MVPEGVLLSCHHRNIKIACTLQKNEQQGKLEEQKWEGLTSGGSYTMGFLPKGIRKTYEIGKTIGRQPPLLLVSVDTCLLLELVVLCATDSVTAYSATGARSQSSKRGAT